MASSLAKDKKINQNLGACVSGLNSKLTYFHSVFDHNFYTNQDIFLISIQIIQ